MRDLFVKQTPTLLLWPICILMDLILIITPLKPNTRTLSRPIPMPTAALVGTDWNEMGGSYNFYVRTPGYSKFQEFMQNMPIYTRKKPVNCYHGGQDIHIDLFHA